MRSDGGILQEMLKKRFSDERNLFVSSKNGLTGYFYASPFCNL